MQPPFRPFESLDWYREASRREYRSGNAGHQILRWLRSSRCYAFHIGLFALGITVALAINVARSPGSLWVDTMATAWLLLLVIHAVILALVFAVGLLGSNEQKLPTYVPREASNSAAGGAPETAQPTSFRWPEPPTRPAAQQASMPTPPDPVTSRPQPGWEHWDRPPQERPTDGWPASEATGNKDTASWRETSPANWLRRKRTAAESTGEVTKPESAGSEATPPNRETNGS